MISKKKFSSVQIYQGNTTVTLDEFFNRLRYIENQVDRSGSICVLNGRTMKCTAIHEERKQCFKRRESTQSHLRRVSMDVDCNSEFVSGHRGIFTARLFRVADSEKYQCAAV